MIRQFIQYAILVFVLSLLLSCEPGEDVKMFKQYVQNLLEAEDEVKEEDALATLLKSTRKNYSINYGYRVFNKTKNKRITNNEIHEYLKDELVVTIFVGDSSPYEEFIWYPKNNEHITRLIMP